MLPEFILNLNHNNPTYKTLKSVIIINLQQIIDKSILYKLLALKTYCKPFLFVLIPHLSFKNSTVTEYQNIFKTTTIDISMVKQ